MTDALRALFDSLRSEEHLGRMVREGREESLYLEFKEKRDRRNGDLDQEDRKNFSMTLSAFANGAGGVLIFGIASRKAPDAPDRASALKPITGAGGLLAKLKDSVLTTTQPVVDDVEFRFIASDEAAVAGYVTCLVPQSDKPPHRAMVDREYYRRTDNGCRRLEHLDLEDMFGRRPRPLLSLRVELRPGLGTGSDDLHLFILNEGRTVARYPGLLGTLADPGVAIAGGDGELLDVTYLNGVPCFQFSDNVGVIHPNGIFRALGRMFVRRLEREGPLTVHLKWYCDGMRAKEAVVEVVPGLSVTVR